MEKFVEEALEKVKKHKNDPEYWKRIDKKITDFRDQQEREADEAHDKVMDGFLQLRVRDMSKEERNTFIRNIYDGKEELNKELIEKYKKDEPCKETLEKEDDGLSRD